MKKLIHLIIAVVLFMNALCFVGCTQYVDFSTQYTKEEHIERISLRTGYALSEDLRDSKIEDIDVEILYAFYDEDPEYFLVEVEYKEEFTGTYGKNNPTTYTIKYKHVIGCTVEDEYYYERNYYNGFMDGRSAYSIAGYKDAKKYYGTINGVQTDDGILQIYAYSLHNQVPVEFSQADHFEQKILPEDSLKDYRCGIIKNSYSGGDSYGKGYVAFTTEYSELQHTFELTHITNSKYKDELDDGVLKDFTVETVYSTYTGKPEYFLIEFEYFEEREIAYLYTNPDNPEERLSATFKTKYQHIMVTIIDDEYYVFNPFWYTAYDDLNWQYVYVEYMHGQSAYALTGYKDAKKYYGAGKLAVQTDDGILQICDMNGTRAVLQKDDPCDVENERFQTKLIDEFAVYYEGASRYFCHQPTEIRKYN